MKNLEAGVVPELGNDVGGSPRDMKDRPFRFSSVDTYARRGTLGDRMHYLAVRTTCKCN